MSGTTIFLLLLLAACAAFILYQFRTIQDQKEAISIADEILAELAAENTELKCIVARQQKENSAIILRAQMIGYGGMTALGALAVIIWKRGGIK